LNAVFSQQKKKSYRVFKPPLGGWGVKMQKDYAHRQPAERLDPFLGSLTKKKPCYAEVWKDYFMIRFWGALQRKSHAMLRIASAFLFSSSYNSNLLTSLKTKKPGTSYLAFSL